jgi:twitching motility protein PilI
LAEGRYGHFVDRAFHADGHDWACSRSLLSRTPEFRQAAA